MTEPGKRTKGFWVRIREACLRPSIRTYLIAMNMIVLCLLFPTVSIFFLDEVSAFRDTQLARALQEMRGNLEGRGLSLTRSMALSASQAIAGYDFTFLNIMVHQVAADDTEIRYCIVMDDRRKATAHSVSEKVGSILDGPLDLAAAEFLATLPKIRNHANHPAEDVRFVDGTLAGPAGEEPVMEVVTPIYNGDRLWGVLRCGYSLQRLQAETSRVEEEWARKMRDFNFSFLSMSAIFFSMGAVIAALFTRSFARSMDRLGDGVARVTEGNLRHKISQSGMVCAEVMELSGAFNGMTDRLRLSYDELEEHRRSLADKVEEKTRELKEAQANLIQQAHEAGMAEMAVGILHNIGNAITPAKISTSLLRQRVTQSAIRRNLPLALEQIRAVVEKGDTMVETEKHRLLDLLRLLPAGLDEECEHLSRELALIAEKHDHIEAIINLQMRYARLFGQEEEVNISRLAEDALRLLRDAILKREVVVARELAEVPPVHIEEAKLIQIFINLIKNGYEAMEELPPEARRLVVSTGFEPGEPGMVVFSVRDQGLGFAPEDREKLFQFGYSTKERGSGFGLHSCANYIIAQRGRIFARSAGLGKGAEFIVKLPVAAEKNPPAGTE